MNNEDWGRYRASREWAIRKREVTLRSGGICERCRVRPQEHIHHVTYARAGQERLEDLLGLCRPCHQYESGFSDIDPLTVPA
jgi:5-methylcytosine-specific restriction endonuclease McrA